MTHHCRHAMTAVVVVRRAGRTGLRLRRFGASVFLLLLTLALPLAALLDTCISAVRFGSSYRWLYRKSSDTSGADKGPRNGGGWNFDVDESVTAAEWNDAGMSTRWEQSVEDDSRLARVGIWSLGSAGCRIALPSKAWDRFTTFGTFP